MMTNLRRLRLSILLRKGFHDLFMQSTTMSAWNEFAIWRYGAAASLMFYHAFFMRCDIWMKIGRDRSTHLRR